MYVHNCILTLAASMPQVQDVVNPTDAGKLQPVEELLVDMGNGGLTILTKVGIILIIGAIFVAIIGLAVVSKQNKPEWKDRILIAALCMILFGAVLSYAGFAQNTGSKMFDDTSTQTTQTTNSGGAAGK